MKLGVSEFATTSPIENHAEIIAAGMDFVEVGLGKAAGMSEEDFEVAARSIEEAGSRVLSCNWFLPPELKVTGVEVDEGIQDRFLEVALARAARLGAGAIVFGSPVSRSVPEGFSFEEAWEQMRGFCVRVADAIAAAGYDLRLAIENVNYTETNLVRKLAEAVRMAREIDRPEVGVAVDFYHLVMEEEPLEVIREAEGLVAAVQLADPETRGFPVPGKEVAGLDRFFGLLREVGYEGGVSVEGVPGDCLGESCRGALKVLRELSV